MLPESKTANNAKSLKGFFIDIYFLCCPIKIVRVFSRFLAALEMTSSLRSDDV